ncbi:MAG: type IV secretion system protein [Halothiobacillaceae bacterium]|nr:type IV secretion system protein [Halothiobacillaceae bacterium]
MKIFTDKSNTKELTPETFEQAALSFERSKNDELKLSRRFALIVAGVACLLAALGMSSAAIAIYKREVPKPILITLDKATGFAEVRREVDDAPAKFDEVTDKYWLSQYVCKRHGYDWFQISTDYDIVKLMSSDDVGKEYDREVQGKNAPLNVYGEKARVRCVVIGVSFVGSAAQIRFSTEKLDATGFNNDGSPTFFWNATAVYEYEPSREMTEKQREANPLGLTVLSYRRDAEVRQ